jgi:DNA-binding transcriptional ArsR family regulator
MNRCIELTVDESRRQTRRIQDVQRQLETVAGLELLQKRAALQLLHQNAQRLLSPVHVVNNLAPTLDFTDARIRSRRDNAKFLTLIRAVAFVHQHQRELKRLADGTAYIEVTVADIAIAERLAKVAFPRAPDELPPKTRELLERLRALVAARHVQGDDDVAFTVRDVREALQMGHSAVAKHIKRLVELEYLEASRTVHHSQREWFRLVEGPGAFDGSAEKPSAVSEKPSAPLPHPTADGFDAASIRKDTEDNEPSTLPRSFPVHAGSHHDGSAMTHAVEAAE